MSDYDDDNDDEVEREPEREEEEEEDEGVNGPRVIFTVSGLPQDTDPIRLLRTLDDIAEAAGHSMGKLEIGMTPNVPDDTYASAIGDVNIQKFAKEMAVDGTNINLHMKALSAAELVLAKSMDLSEQKWQQELDKLTPEEIETRREHYQKQSEESHRRSVQELQQQRTDEVRQAFDIANQWATEPDLTAMERCHGVAHDIYSLYGVDKKPLHLGDNPNYIHPTIAEAYSISAGQAYAQHYDTQLSEQIRERQIKAARELFGDPK